MSHAKFQDNSNPVSLLPFLAVLICTMGSLLLILVVVTRVSREQATRRLADGDDAQRQRQQDFHAQVEQKLDNVQGYSERLDQVRAAASQKLHEEQLRLSHIEDHMRRLHQELDTLRLAAIELNALEEQHYDDQEQMRGEAERLKKLIAETRDTVEDLKQEQQSAKPHSYAIIPYEGPYRTRRPVVYVECRGNGVTLQPEGVELTPQDFERPLGPGNPLAAALRAVREYMVARNSTSEPGVSQEPYPLILVRPDGVEMYYAVRTAIESWDSSFGYELVDTDWELKFPPSNPELASVEQQAIERARRRQEMLAIAAPRAYANRRDSVGGFALSSESGRGDRVAGEANPELADQAYGHGDSIAEHGETPTESNDSGGPADLAASEGPPRNETSQRPSDRYDESAHASTPHDDLGAALASEDVETSASPGDAQSRRTGSNSSAAGAASESAMSPSAMHPNGPSVANALATPDPAADSSFADDVQEGDTTDALTAAESDEASPTTTFQSGESQRLSLQSSGKGSSRRDGRPNDIPIRRNIHVVVTADELSILENDTAADEPEHVRNDRTIALRGSPQSVTREFFSALEEHVKEWGIAGRGLYWRPVLMLDVMPGGQKHAAELERLLRKRGVETTFISTAEVNNEPEFSNTR